MKLNAKKAFHCQHMAIDCWWVRAPSVHEVAVTADNLSDHAKALPFTEQRTDLSVMGVTVAIIILTLTHSFSIQMMDQYAVKHRTS